MYQGIQEVKQKNYLDELRELMNMLSMYTANIGTPSSIDLAVSDMGVGMRLNYEPNSSGYGRTIPKVGGDRPLPMLAAQYGVGNLNLGSYSSGKFSPTYAKKAPVQGNYGTGSSYKGSKAGVKGGSASAAAGSSGGGK